MGRKNKVSLKNTMIMKTVAVTICLATTAFASFKINKGERILTTWSNYSKTYVKLQELASELGAQSSGKQPIVRKGIDTGFASEQYYIDGTQTPLMEEFYAVDLLEDAPKSGKFAKAYRILKVRIKLAGRTNEVLNALRKAFEEMEEGAAVEYIEELLRIEFVGNIERTHSD